jgi:hypothetical protein
MRPAGAARAGALGAGGKDQVKEFTADISKVDSAPGFYRFRIGHEAPDAVQFTADARCFQQRLGESIIEWGTKHGRFVYLNLQVLCPAGAGWRNIQNPKTGGHIAIFPEIAGDPTTCGTVFEWAGKAIAMCEAIGGIASGLAGEVE